jgi:DNA-binding transcriptional MerR regulator
MTEDAPRPHRIGEVAARLGVSTRTLRYYEELGLLDPTGRTSGGSRRYSERDVARLRRILELRDVIGFELDRISLIIRAESRLEELRDLYRSGTSPQRRAEIIAEASAINEELRSHVSEKLAILQAFARDLDERASRLEVLAEARGAPGAPRR